MANRTFDTVLSHFSFIHIPTFRLLDTAACLCFAICTVGGIRTGKQKYDHQDMMGRPQPNRRHDQTRMDGPIPSGQSWESLYKANYQDRSGRIDGEDMKKVEEWENAPIVRNEKTNMLIKVGQFWVYHVTSNFAQSFSLAQGVLMTEYNVALLQALVLYNAPYFLSEDENERALANMFLGTIVNVRVICSGICKLMNLDHPPNRLLHRGAGAL